MRHSWLNRLVPVLLVASGSVVFATPAHASTAATGCDPLKLKASIGLGSETVVFKMKNCTTTAQKIVLSGKRKAPGNCKNSSNNYGDSPVIALAPGQSKVFYHYAPTPRCKGTYTVTGDSELKGTETVLDVDVATYPV